MFEDDDLLIFTDDNIIPNDDIVIEPWRVLIVDDEIDIHTLTKMVLKGFTFENRPLEINSVYSGAEAIEFLKIESDIAIILLDVVMETEDAGLRCVKIIREELQNLETRIILRTGQPGQAPEQQIIVNYDINDYKAKTELTASKLFTTITSSLRSYQYIQTINQNKIGLENIIAASSFLFEVQSFSLFAKGILKQLTAILSLDKDALYINSSSFSAFKEAEKPQYSILAGTGSFANHEKKIVEDVLSTSIQQRLQNAVDRHESIFDENTYTGYFETVKGEHTLLYLQWQRPLTDVDKHLISIFATNVAAAFENISLHNDMSEAQREIVYTLSEVIEGLSSNTPCHIKSVTDISCIIAQKLKLSDHDIENLKMAAPLYDIGKIAVPKSILIKPGALTPEEREIMENHTNKGFEVFSGAKRGVMSAAQIISSQHHEKWNGNGYPLGLKGEEIHVYARIVGLADVVEALTNKRSYGEPWDMKKVIDLIKEEKGQQFDPEVVDAFLDSIDEIKAIKLKYGV
ncbi:MAG: DUF3369 domain-containing protein [Spirochaetaceae bacterium]